MSFHVPGTRPDSKITLKGASVWTKKKLEPPNSAVKPVSSGDFFNFTRLIAKCNSSNVHGCLRTKVTCTKGSMCLSNVDLEDPPQKLINSGINVYQLPSRAATSFSPKRLERQKRSQHIVPLVAWATNTDVVQYVSNAIRIDSSKKRCPAGFHFCARRTVVGNASRAYLANCWYCPSHTADFFFLLKPGRSGN